MDIKVHKNDLPEDLELGNKIAIDCEFMGLNFNRDKLCIVQISSGKSDAHIVQLDRKKYNAPILKKILSEKSIKKIFHFARADVGFIKKYLEVEVENLEDTKIQSKLARSYSYKHGLKDLIKVLYLHKINDALNKILIREDRHGLYLDCLKFINTRVELDLASFPNDIWSH